MPLEETPRNVAPDTSLARGGAARAAVGRRFALCVGVLPIGAASIACLWRPDFAAAATLVPAWLWLAAGFGSVLAGWRLRSRRFAGGLALLWIVFALGWVEEIRSLSRSLIGESPARGDSAKKRLRVVSLNAAGTTLCRADLQRIEPDIVLLQESPGGEHLRRLAQDLFGSDAGVLDGGDTALLARGSIVPRFVDQRRHFVVGGVSLAGGGELCCVSLRLDPPPSRFDAWAQGFWEDHAKLRAEHRRQLEDVVTRIAELPRDKPLVIGGDFNTVPFDRALEMMHPEFSDAFIRCGRGWAPTGTNEWPLFRVDQIWTGSRVAPVEVRAEKTTGSDHRMVVCGLIVE